jgi:small subunit ribosomal protein S3
MGQKVHPYGFRLQSFGSKFINYSEGVDYVNKLHKDLKVYFFINKKYKDAGIADVRIERPAKNADIKIYCAKPGVLIGRKGSDVEQLRAEIGKILQVNTKVTVIEAKKVDLIAKLVAEAVAAQLERRVPFRKAMRKAVQSTQRAGAQGIKICVSGRLGGAEIARSEGYHEGRVPLHTLRANIDYHLAEAHTTYGIIGVKVWIYKGEIVLTKNETKG